ncbi:MAG: LAGLIDADG family homing endonuclease [bacterium]|nr:LAGLIDADG family homing endonuclease [bacterium]
MEGVNKLNLAYIVGVALGDGNLSNPNGRAVRLRVTCDTKYPDLIKRIIKNLQTILPNNKVSIVPRNKNYLDVSCFSNKLENLLGWKVGQGSKIKQKARAPRWIFSSKKLIRNCLKGLIETDGSIYLDRKYTMVNFITAIPELAKDVMEMMQKLGYKPNMQIYVAKNRENKHTIRISKNTKLFIKEINLEKS